MEFKSHSSKLFDSEWIFCVLRGSKGTLMKKYTFKKITLEPDMLTYTLVLALGGKGRYCLCLQGQPGLQSVRVT